MKADVQKFEFDLEDNLFLLQELLVAKTWQHAAYDSFFVQDPKLRHIHKASVGNRVFHQALFRILYPIFDREFIFDSYSCRIDKGTHRAVLRLEKFARKLSQNYSRPIYALKCDIRKFFDSIDQTILMNLIKKKISDEATLELVKLILGSFHNEDGRGLPLGNVTSQLFANIYLNELDQFMKHNLKAKSYLRYCDDFIILGENRDELVVMVEKIQKFLTSRLKLSLHDKKIIIRKLSQGVDFLGYVVLPHYRVLRTKTKNRILRKIDEKSLPSYLGVLSHCRGYKIRRMIEKEGLVGL
jgi:RNA-directed DNA polymerase